MPVQFAVLASGSRGNASIVQAGGVATLIDVGLGPRALAARLASVGSGWDRVANVVLTHTHGDHVCNTTLRWMARRQIDLYCHEGHRPTLASFSGFRELEQHGHVRSYEESPFLSPTGLRIEPVRLRHDGGPTFGFRVEGKDGRRSPWSAIGYMADTGSWTLGMAEAMVDVDLLGVEFNHDVDLQRRSGRAPALIARNLGDWGHLSNSQGADLISAIMERSRPGTLRHVVLLHLSEQCNRPPLALGAARGILRRVGRRATIHAAQQGVAEPNLEVRAARRRSPAASRGAVAGFPWESG